MQDKFVIDSQEQMNPTAREAILSEESDELESYKTFFNNFKKRESCPACGQIMEIFQIDAKDEEKSFVPIG